jgi:Xaa-Pro aminopeptidase
MPTDPQRWRLAQLREGLHNASLGGALIVHLPMVRYLTRFSGSNALLLVLEESVHLFTDDRYAEQVKTELAKLPGLSVHITRDAIPAAAQVCRDEHVASLGIEYEHITLAQHAALRTAMRGIKLRRLFPLDHLRMVKFKPELEALRQAARIASTVYEEVVAQVRPGMRESEVAAELSYRARRLGSEADAFDIIVVAGEHGAFVHGRASSRQLRKGDVVTVDFGCRIGGFHSDMTRTFYVGHTVPAEVQRAWEIVRRAHERALECLQPGVSAAAVDRAARDVIEGAGLGEFFKHSLGHGLGLEVHEPPAISWRNTKGIIPARSVVTIEPGVYLPGKFGMRLEDDVYIGERGIELLTTAPRELLRV